MDASFSAALDQVRGARGIGGKPLVVVLGSRGDGSIPALRDLFARQAALSANSSTVMVAGAMHAGLVDNRTRALQTSAAILGVIRAARTDAYRLGPNVSAVALRPEPPPAPRQAGDAPVACAR